MLLTSCRVDERVLFMVAMFLVALAFFILIPMGNELPKITISSKQMVAHALFTLTWCLSAHLPLQPL